MINKFYGKISEKNGAKYFTIVDNEDVLKIRASFSGIKYHIS